MLNRTLLEKLKKNSKKDEQIRYKFFDSVLIHYCWPRKVISRIGLHPHKQCLTTSPPILKQPARTPTQLSRLAERHELPSWSTSKKNIFLSRLPYFSTMGNLREYFYESLYCKSFYDDYDIINVFRWCTTNKSRETENVQFCLCQRATA